MSGFVGDTSSSSSMSWRDQQMGRELPPTVPPPHHQEAQHHHHHQIHQQQHHQSPYHHPPPPPPPSHMPSHHMPSYDRYSPSVGSEGEDFRSPHPHHSSHSQGLKRENDLGLGPQSSGDQHLSVGERRQEKRKNKRHRLTHNETRFLMSEFARQAHPDAALRERLAREIPGLTPRQVQVWFQNRRAKLKRMSSDDRERMMKSRALPEDFSILQTLHYTNNNNRVVGTPLASPTEYSPTTNVGFRPDTLRRRHMEEEVGVSPTSNAFASLSFTPPAASNDLMSPGPSNNDRPGYLPYMTAPLGPPQQRGNPFSRPTEYRPPNVPRLQLHDVPRSLAEGQTTPVRTNPFPNHHLDNGEYQLSPSYNMQSFVEPPRSVPQEGVQTPYGHVQQQHQQSTYGQSYPSPAPQTAPIRPPPFPSPLGMNDYKYPQGPMTPHSATLSSFSNSNNLAQNPDYHMPQLSAPADAANFGSSYLTRPPSGPSVGPGNHGNPGSDEEERERHAGRELGHRRNRSSSHPPSFQQVARG